jgi:hypothetical protein
MDHSFGDFPVIRGATGWLEAAHERHRPRRGRNSLFAKFRLNSKRSKAHRKNLLRPASLVEMPHRVGYSAVALLLTKDSLLSTAGCAWVANCPARQPDENPLYPAQLRASPLPVRDRVADGAQQNEVLAFRCSGLHVEKKIPPLGQLYQAEE